MTLLYGTAITSSLCLLMIMAGYTVAGFIPTEGRLVRLAMANLAGLAWLILGASVLGAVAPLRGAGVWLLWSPVLAAWLIPATRRQLWEDLYLAGKSSRFYACVIGLLLFWSCLLLPFSVYPDIFFFDGGNNHDNFFWCTAAEYLQNHDYLATPVGSADYPLFNMVGAITGWKPAWGRMGAEGLLAVTSSSLLISPVQSYNFVVCSLVLPWLLTVLAVARQMGVPPLNRWLLIIVCFCQPILAFFIANGNLPNLLGTIFGGGLWLLSLLLCETRSRHSWPLGVAGALCIHGMLCCYPEIFPFALIPVALLAVRHFSLTNVAWLKPRGILALLGVGGLLLNPLTSVRAWNGFWVSLGAVRNDAMWGNLFAPLNFAEYIPSLVTLEVPNVKLYGYTAGSLASLAILISTALILRKGPRPWLILISLSAFFAMLLYTVLTSFSYGWQKSVQFSGIQLAVFFPAFIAGRLQATLCDPPAWRWPARIALLATLGVLLHGMSGITMDNLKWAGFKGLTMRQLTLGKRIAEEFPGQPVYVDGDTFYAQFFHSMWSSRLFAHNPLVFAPREKQAGGYLDDSIQRAPLAAPPPTGLYYVGSDWAEAFDTQARIVATDRVGVLLRHHNLVTELEGFYPVHGLPVWTRDRFQLAIYPYADGLLEIILQPNGDVAPECTLHGSVTTSRGIESVTAGLDARRRLVARFPLKAGLKNEITAAIQPFPVTVTDTRSTRFMFPFHVAKIQTFFTAATLSPVNGIIDFSETGNSHLYGLSGFALANGNATWTNQAHPLIQFHPAPAEHDIELEIEASPYLAKGVVDMQPTQLRINGELIFAAPFTEPGVLRARIFREKWNESPIATIQLHLPKTHSLPSATNGDQAFGLAIRRLIAKPALSPRP